MVVEGADRLGKALLNHAFRTGLRWDLLKARVVTALACMTRNTVPTPISIFSAILSMDTGFPQPEHPVRSKMRFGRPMALPLFVPAGHPATTAH